MVTSEEWSRYSDLGEVSAIYMHVDDPETGVRTILVTKERRVVLMQEASESEDLEFIRRMQGIIAKVEGSN